ncbi:Ig-like domain-containing protein [Pseudoalteromonas luteoviolacea]|uniref:Ig-like domain-containing protein n=1 Tax=Pseudoalteromonas luteoviolacea TaxID=43657 RepID=UPI001B359F17|nr:Ig-like domain-containing protein [Pseudoalteromonas luteoviolacea]MBQ4810197.1 Ig-like domain-containing protein [Pseudoalteromonas luteoviolacea]
MNRALLLGALLFFSSISSATLSAQCSDIRMQVHVSAVYPTADTLPENLLRFYIYFNQAMRTTNTLAHIYLTDESGQRLAGVFLENKFSLWSPDRTRLTLLFDPGRVKTGLVAHNSLGRALEVGKTYHLVVDAGALNRSNCADKYIKTFKVSQAIDSKPTISNWVVNQPLANSKMPLTIDFTSSIDHTSLAFRIRVKNTRGDTVAGSIDIAQEEKRWVFTPKQSWQPEESYTLVIDAILEDIAGNRITGLFDQPELVEGIASENMYFSLPIALNQKL